MTNALMLQPRDTHTVPSKKRASRLMVSACVLALAATSHVSFAMSFDAYDGCYDLCSEEFWAKADASDVVAALASEPEAVSYRSHILRLAVASGARPDGVAALLRAGAPPNARYETDDSRYVLQEAARHSEEVVSRLLAGGALVQLADNEGRTPLHEAVQSNRVGAVGRLLEAGADPEAPDASGTTPIDLARQTANDDTLALLLAPRASRPPCGKLCTTEFWKAATATDIRDALAQAGGPEGRTADGDTPLHLALALGADPESVRVLLEHGANPNDRNARDDSPLHVAAGTTDGAAAIAMLLAHGALRDAANADDWTPLHIASESAATIGAMRALLEAGANPDIRAGHLFGVSPRELAAQQPGGPEATALLLDVGDSTKAATETTLVPLLHHAARAGHPRTVEMLRDRGAFPANTDVFGDTAFHEAASAGNMETMRVLLTQGAKGTPPKDDGTAIVREQGHTLLRIAAPYPEMVALLLEHGANPHGDSDIAVETPLHAASRICQGSSLALLLARGADPNAQNEYGDTPLTHAVQRVAVSGTVGLEDMSKLCAAHTHPRDRERCRAAVDEDFKRRFEPREECENNLSVLIRHGANAATPGYGGLTPLALARQEQLHDSLIRVLERSNLRE